MPLEKYDSLCGERQAIIVSKDSGQRREHRATNASRCRVSHYQIDGYVVQDDSIRCDFLLMNDDKTDAYLIELKGSDIEHALEQLEATAIQLKEELHGYTVKYRLVHSRAKTQAMRGIKFKKFKQRHSKVGEFAYKENLLEEII